jgi:hypothetical protein
MEEVKNWKELSKVSESKTHKLEIEDDCGWIITKETGNRSYLSTHFFYGKEFQNSTRRLQSCGFDVEIINSDNQT